MKVIIAGGSGFIGQALVRFFKKNGHSVHVLSRKPNQGDLFWDPANKQLDPTHLENCDCVINLAGESIIGRWNQRKIERIRESRFAATRLLVNTIQSLKNPPKLYIGASAIGYYGDRNQERLSESSTLGHGYLAEIAHLWEEIPQKLENIGIRVAFLRLGIVLGKTGGALAKMLPAFKLGLGGRLGDGQQMMSWIAIEDVCSAFLFVMEKDLRGPINCVSPNPVSNYTFTKMLGKVLKRPTILPIPSFVLKLLFGSGAEIFLASLNVFPEKLQKAGFRFHFPDLEGAVTEELMMQ